MDRHVHDHPLREEGVRLLALALYRCGRAPEALETLRRTRGRLRDELGLDPGPDLAALERDILDQADHLSPDARLPSTVVTPATVPAAVAPVDDGSVVLGREKELARLEGRAELVAQGASELVLVAGEAGGGKTALMATLGGRLAERGWLAVRGRCPEVEGAPPAWAWTEVARGLSPGGGAVPDGGGDAVFHRGQAIADLLGRRGEHQPVLVTLDDLHRADDETLRLLRVVVAAAPARVLVVGTHRPDESGPGSALEATFAALASAVGDRLTLPGLAAEAIGALLDRHGVDADPALVARVLDRTGGNPLFVREVARLGDAGLGTSVPEGVRDVLRRRVATLPGGARTVLGHAALFGREVEVEVLLGFERVVGGGADEDGALDALESAMDAGVLDEPAGGRVRFTHDLWREVLHADLPRLRRARLHATALGVLEKQSEPANRAALAHHALNAGDRVEPARRLEHVVAAAEQATSSGAFRRAAQLWRAGVEAAEGAGLSVARELDLRCGLISALARAGTTETAWAERTVALDLARPLADPEITARILTCADAPAPWPDALHPGALIPELDPLLDAQRTDGWVPEPALRARLLVASAFESEYVDRARSDEHSRLALETARTLDEPRLLCAALDARMLASTGPEQWHRIGTLGAEMLDLAIREGYEDYRAEAHHLLFCAANLREDIQGARAHADAALACATAGQLDTVLVFTGIYPAVLALVEGRLDDAERIYGEEIDRLRVAGAPNAWPVGVAAAAAVAHARGDLSPVLPAVTALHEVAAERTNDLLALCLVDAGRTAEARRAWRPEVPPARDQTWLGWNVLRADVAIGLGHREAAEVARRALQPWSGWKGIAGHGVLVFGPVDLALARLARFLGRPEQERRHHLEVAERVAVPSAPWLARVAEERARG